MPTGQKQEEEMSQLALAYQVITLLRQLALATRWAPAELGVLSRILVKVCQ